MGYNTVSANGFAEGNTKEDTLLLNLAARENRLLLTRDFELALRGKDQALLIKSDEVMEQVQRLIDSRIDCPPIDDDPLFAVQHRTEGGKRRRDCRCGLCSPR